MNRFDMITGEDYFDKHGYYRETIKVEDGEFVLFDDLRVFLEKLRE